MATNTTYFNLTKPAYEEDADVAVINSNMDKIDSALYNIRLRGAENLADIYDSSESYAVDDYCVYLQADGYHLYKCISATTGAFDVNDWSEVNVVEELASGGGQTEVTLTETVSSVDYTCKYVKQGKVVNVTGTMLGDGTNSGTYWFANLPNPAVANVPVLVYLTDGSGVVSQILSANGILADANLTTVGTFAFSYLASA